MDICAFMQSVSCGTADKANTISGWQPSNDLTADNNTTSFYETVRQILDQWDRNVDRCPATNSDDSSPPSDQPSVFSLVSLLEGGGLDKQEANNQTEIAPEQYAAAMDFMAAVADPLEPFKTPLHLASNDSMGTGTELPAQLQTQLTALETAFNDVAPLVDGDTREAFVESISQIKTMMAQPKNTTNGADARPTDGTVPELNRSGLLERTIFNDSLSHPRVDVEVNDQIDSSMNNRANRVTTNGMADPTKITKDETRVVISQDNTSPTIEMAKTASTDRPAIQAWMSPNNSKPYPQTVNQMPVEPQGDSERIQLSYPKADEAGPLKTELTAVPRLLHPKADESGPLKTESTAVPRFLDPGANEAVPLKGEATAAAPSAPSTPFTTVTTVMAHEDPQLVDETPVSPEKIQKQQDTHQSRDLPSSDKRGEADHLSKSVSASSATSFTMDRTMSTAETSRPLSIPVPDDTALQKSVFDQIVEKITVRTSNDQSEMRIQLKPETLGDVRMRVVTEKNQVVVQMIADKADTKELIESQIHHLRAELDKQGLTVGKIEVMLGSANDQQDSRGPFSQMMSNHSSGNGKRQNSAEQESARRHQPNPDKDSEPADDGINYFA